MSDIHMLLTELSSIVLRIVSFIFLRWIPGHPFPPIVGTLGIAYSIGFLNIIRQPLKSSLTVSEVDVVEKRINGHPVPNGRYTNGSATIDEDDEQEGEFEIESINLAPGEGPSAMRILLTGRPSSSAFWWSAATLSINALLILMVLDLTFTATWYHQAPDLSFARMGYVSDTTAKVFVREPSSTQYPLYLSYRYLDKAVSKEIPYSPFDSAWKSAGSATDPTESTDFTQTFTITGLKPDTRYQYAFSNAKNGHFITAPRDGHFSRHTTASSKLTFVHSSCIIPGFPYNPMNHPLSIRGMSNLISWLPSIRPAFMLFLGDFIYIDVPRRHGVSVEDYRRAYRQVYASPEWDGASKVPAALSAGRGAEAYDLPWVHVYDDHEIANDWAGNTSGVFPAAFDPYLHYHLAPNPPLPLSASRRANLFRNDAGNTALTLDPENLAHDDTATWSAFVHGLASFFMLDTRRYRAPPNLSNTHDPSISMLGPAQLAALLAWLEAPPPTGIYWKFVISSVPFTKNWRVNALDTWAGYLAERRKILEVMWRVQATSGVGIVVLSGDRHEFAATAIPPPDGFDVLAASSRAEPTDATQKPLMVDKAATTIHEFSTSPLSQFYLPVRTYRRSEPGEDHEGEESDLCLKYVAAGNSKFGIVEIEPATGSGRSVLRYRVVIDGEEVWSHVLVSGTTEEVMGKRLIDDGVWG